MIMKPKEKPKAVRQKKEKPDKKQTKTVKGIRFDDRSDAGFSSETRADLLKIINWDKDNGVKVQEQYVAQKIKDYQQYNCEKPSKLEDLQKRSWMSDRNLGLARATADTYQAILLATCWNPDSLNFVPTSTMTIDNRNNQKKFTQWGMGKQEANVKPEVDDFIHNRIVFGFSIFKIYRKKWFEWVDKRIPVPSKGKDKKTYKYDIKTEKVELERGLIENIADIDDILMPTYGKDIQKLSYFIHILHLDGEEVLDYIDRKVFVPTDKEAYKKKLLNHAWKQKTKEIGEEKLKELGLTEESMTESDVRRMNIDLYEWYGYYTKNDRNERFRITVDLLNEEFLAGKPIRKISRSGKIPFSGGPLYRTPGHIRGVSLMQVITPVVNAFNNVFNQKSDFQYVTNCPIGFHNPSEGFTNQAYKLEPMTSYPVDGKPSENVYFPNLSRSMAWAEQDMRILMEILEKLTGAATYFMTNQRGVSGTATRDVMIDKNSETRFGLWVSRIQQDICEAVSMWFELYQDFPPKKLAERILGKDGKQIFRNLSIDTLRGDSDVEMTPDIVAGSRAYRKQLRLEAFAAGQNMIWLHPQVNPKGNWNLCADTMRDAFELTDTDVVRYLGEEPKSEFDEAQLDAEWYRFAQGEDFDPPEGETNLAIEHLKGHYKQKEEKYNELDEEYRPIFDKHLFATTVNAMKFMRNAQRDMIANQMASREVMARGGGPGQFQPVAPGGPGPAGPAAPGGGAPPGGAV